MKKLLSLALILVMCLALSGTAEISYPVETDETITIWKVLDGDATNAGYTTSMDTPGFKKWVADCGINVELKEFADNTALILALQGSDVLPDAFMIDHTAYNGDILGMAADGLVIEITPEMCEEFAPDYWEIINSLPAYLQQIVQLDGKMYSLSPHFFREGSIYRYWKGFQYRTDILSANGLEIPSSNTEFKALLEALKEVEGVEVPWVFDCNEFVNVVNFGYITSEYDLVNCAGYQVDGEFHFGAYEEAYREVMRFMNELYTEGLISEDFATMDAATAQSMVIKGTAPVFYGNNTRLNTLYSSMEEGSEFTGGPVLHRDDQDKALYSYADNYVTNGDGLYITPDCKNVELTMAAFNYVFTYEGNLLRNYGTEGRSYTFVDGVPTYTEFVTNNPDGLAMDPITRTEGLVNWFGLHEDNLNRQRHPRLEQVDAYEMWADTYFDKYNPIYASVLPENLDEYTGLWTDIDTYIKECRVKFISGQMNLDDDFDAYIEHLGEMGMDRVIEIKQATLDAYAEAIAG